MRRSMHLLMSATIGLSCGKAKDPEDLTLGSGNVRVPVHWLSSGVDLPVASHDRGGWFHLPALVLSATDETIELVRWGAYAERGDEMRIDLAGREITDEERRKLVAAIDEWVSPPLGGMIASDMCEVVLALDAGASPSVVVEAFAAVRQSRCDRVEIASVAESGASGTIAITIPRELDSHDFVVGFAPDGGVTIDGAPTSPRRVDQELDRRLELAFSVGVQPHEDMSWGELLPHVLRLGAKTPVLPVTELPNAPPPPPPVDDPVPPSVPLVDPPPSGE